MLVGHGNGLVKYVALSGAAPQNRAPRDRSQNEAVHADPATRW